MIEWLVYHGIPFNSHALKPELFAIIQSKHIKRRYVVDEMAKTGGHEVVCAHCTLNPISS